VRQQTKIAAVRSSAELAAHVLPISSARSAGAVVRLSGRGAIVEYPRQQVALAYGSIAKTFVSMQFEKRFHSIGSFRRRGLGKRQYIVLPV
jgi:hypothetical protein